MQKLLYTGDLVLVSDFSMSVCTSGISWLSLVTVVTNAVDPGLLLWLDIVTTMIKMTTTTTAMSIPATITTDAVTMATNSADSV